MKLSNNWIVVPALIIGLLAVAYFWGTIRQLGLRTSLGANAPILPTGSPLTLPNFQLSQ